MSDMQQKSKSIPLIHFSEIEFNVRKSFVSGGLSRVYFGTYRGDDVAIKILFAMELTPKIVEDFFKEVQVMYDLHHENVVNCIGMSVMPPTLCVLLEYCSNGSLFHFLHQQFDNEMAVVVVDNGDDNFDKLSASGMEMGKTLETVSNPLNDTPGSTIVHHSDKGNIHDFSIWKR